MAEGQGTPSGAPPEAVQRGARVAIGILLLWFGGTLLFVAFMSGKTPALTVGKDAAGHPQGPADASQLVGRIATVVQTAQGAASTGTGAPV